MALGKKAMANNDNSKLLVLRIRNSRIDPETKKEINLVPNLFEISEKVGNQWTVRPDMESAVAGDLTNVVLGEGEYEGRKYPTAKIYIKDKEENETYLLDLRFGGLTRNLFNSLVALESFNGVRISLYKRPDKKDGKEYPAVSVWQNNTLIKGESWDQWPKPQDIVHKGVVIQRDWSEVNEYFVNKLKELSARLGNKSTEAAPTEAPPPAPVENSVDDGEGVPF